MDLEKQLNLGFGFPAVVAISNSKNKVATMKASFNQENFSTFCNEVISGRVLLDDLKTKIVVKKADAWDGEDAKPIQEESYSDDL